MSRDKRDQRGGHRGRYATNEDNHGWFARNLRRRTRRRAHLELKQGQEPAPQYRHERDYYD